MDKNTDIILYLCEKPRINAELVKKLEEKYKVQQSDDYEEAATYLGLEPLIILLDIPHFALLRYLDQYKDIGRDSLVENKLFKPTATFCFCDNEFVEGDAIDHGASKTITYSKDSNTDTLFKKIKKLGFQVNAQRNLTTAAEGKQEEFGLDIPQHSRTHAILSIMDLSFKKVAAQIWHLETQLTQARKELEANVSEIERLKKLIPPKKEKPLDDIDKEIEMLLLSKTEDPEIVKAVEAMSPITRGAIYKRLKKMKKSLNID